MTICTSAASQKNRIDRIPERRLRDAEHERGFAGLGEIARVPEEFKRNEEDDDLRDNRGKHIEETRGARRQPQVDDFDADVAPLQKTERQTASDRNRNHRAAQVTDGFDRVVGKSTERAVEQRRDRKQQQQPQSEQGQHSRRARGQPLNGAKHKRPRHGRHLSARTLAISALTVCRSSPLRGSLATQASITRCTAASHLR